MSTTLLRQLTLENVWWLFAAYQRYIIYKLLLQKSQVPSHKQVNQRSLVHSCIDEELSTDVTTYTYSDDAELHALEEVLHDTDTAQQDRDSDNQLLEAALEYQESVLALQRAQARKYSAHF